MKTIIMVGLPSFIIMILLLYSYFFASIVLSPSKGKIVFKGKPNKNTEAEKNLSESVKLFKKDNVRSFDDIDLEGYKYHDEATHNWIICVHGYGGNPSNMIKYADHFIKNNFNILLPELRGHGNSECDYTGLSYLDGYDINVWIHHILQLDKSAKIVLFGISLGGASVAMSAEFESINNVKCIITDSAPSNMHTQIKNVYKWISKLPTFPTFYLVEFIIKIKTKIYLKDVNVINNIQFINKPWLIIHGKKDGFVNPLMAENIYNEANSPKTLFLVPGAEHTHAIDEDPIGYWDKVDQFININIK